jgi:hypothetical protein
LSKKIKVVNIKAIIFKLFFASVFAIYALVGIVKHADIYKELKLYGHFYDPLVFVLTTFVVFMFAYMGLFYFVFFKMDGSKIFIYQIGRWREINPTDITQVKLHGSDVDLYVKKINWLGYVRIICNDFDVQKKIVDAIEAIGQGNTSNL